MVQFYQLMVVDLPGNLTMNFIKTKQKINDLKGLFIVKIIINNFRFQDFIKSFLLIKKKSNTKYLLEENNIFDGNQKIGLFPYNVWDCLAIHNIFCKYYKNANCIHPDQNIERREISSLRIKLIRNFRSRNSIKKKNVSLFINDSQKLFEEINIFLKKELGDFSHIATYGLLDNLIKDCNVSIFFNGFIYDKKLLFSYLERILNLTKILCEPFKKIFIAETAYLECSFLRAYSFANSIELFCLHPNGTFRKLDPKESPSESYISDKKDLIFGGNCKINYEELKNLGVDYFRKRLRGEGSDSDSRYAFRNSASKPNKKIKKVLFLHCIRDANNINSIESNIFKTYLEWTNYSLSKIKNDQENWWIKIHPMSSFWKDDIDIIRELFRENNINFSISENCPSTKEILEKGMPIFTCNGTIALESLAFGNYCIATGNRISNSLIKKIDDLNSYENYLLMPVNKCLKNLKAPKEKSILAKSLLMDTKSRCDLEHFFPYKYIQSNDSFLQKLKIIFTIGNKKHNYI